MTVKLSIGDFSRMTFLSIKALRYYHEAGLLTPADIDSETGYRSYQLSQVPTAQVIRRFRDLGMAIEQIKAILSAPNLTERNSLVVEHLRHMETQLAHTQGIVSSLRTLLEDSPAPLQVEYRSVPATRVAAISAVVERREVAPWFYDSLDQISRELRRQHISPAGPKGGLYPSEIFSEEIAEITLFAPIVDPMSPSGNVFIRELPPVDLAVAVHRGPYHDADRTFGALGAHVLERTISVAGPIREHFLALRDDVADESQLVTEVGWPIFRTTHD